MNPLFIWIAAPATALAVLVFVVVYSAQTERIETSQSEQRLQEMEFDRDFANAWNGTGQIEAPDPALIEEQRQQVQAQRQKEQEKAAEAEQELNKLRSELNFEETPEG